METVYWRECDQNLVAVTRGGQFRIEETDVLRIDPTTDSVCVGHRGRRGWYWAQGGEGRKVGRNIVGGQGPRINGMQHLYGLLTRLIEVNNRFDVV